MLSQSLFLRGNPGFTVEVAGEESGALEAQPVGDLVDGDVCVSQKHLRPEDAVGVEPVHYAPAALLPDDGRQVIGRNAQIVSISLDIPGQRVFPAQGVQELLEDALPPA